MRIRCQRCGTQFELADELVPPGGAPVECTHCGHVFLAAAPGKPAPRRTRLLKCTRCGTVYELADAAVPPAGEGRVQCAQCGHVFFARAAGGDTEGAQIFGRADAHPEPPPGAQRMVFGLPAQPPAAPQVPPSRRAVPSDAARPPRSRVAALAEEHAELFRAVVDAPDDDLPRQVLADRLAEQGDPLGELITIQVAAGRGSARGLTRAREQALLAEHARALVPAGVTDAAFVRGFACHCRVASQVHDATDPAWVLVERADFQHLSAHALLIAGALRCARELEGLNANDLNGLLRGRPPARLGRLQLVRVPLGRVPWAELAERLPALEALELAEAPVDAPGLEAAVAAVAASGARLARLRVDAARLDLRQTRALLVQLKSPLVLECQYGTSWVELSAERVRRCHEETDLERESAVRAQLRGLGLAEVELLRPPRGLFHTHHTPSLSGALRVFPRAATRPAPAGRRVSTAPPRRPDPPDPFMFGG